MTVTEALRAVIDHCKDEYAKQYARMALTMDPNSEAYKTQLMYVVCNTNHWHGPVAKEAKTVIRMWWMQNG